MNIKLIIVTKDSWGAGETLTKAKANLKFSGGLLRDPSITYLFVSPELPFVEGAADAEEGQADAYVGRDGVIYWVRCEKIEIDRNKM